MYTKEYHPHDWQPRHLTPAEIADPMQVLEALFDHAHLPGQRRLLWEWLKTTVSGNYNRRSLHYKERESLLAFYEQLQKLVEAAHLLLLARKLALPADLTVPVAAGQLFAEPVAMPAAAEQAPLVARLVAQLNPDFVFALGKLTETGHALPVYHYLVVLPATASQSYAHYQQAAEAAVAPGTGIQLLCIRTGELQRYLQQGHVLFSRVCTAPYLVYRKEELALPEPSGNDLSGQVSAARASFLRAQAKATAFYDGALYYLGKAQPVIASFMLQQAAELGLRGMIQALTGRNYISHSLVALRRRILPFFPELVHLLPVGSQAGACPLRRLSQAYIHARYGTGFELSVAEISQLKAWIGRLLVRMPPAFEQQMALLQQSLER